DALKLDYGAYLLEQNEKSQDNFMINVGALPAAVFRFVIQTAIAPRYNPNKGGISSAAGTTSKYVQTAS
ncbi:unnamed protein product, partial [Rotaria sp. Silwood1]